MRSLTKDVEIINAATYIVKFLKDRFDKDIAIKEAEIEKLKREKSVLEIQRKEIE